MARASNAPLAQARNCVGLRLRPAAVGAVVPELVLDVGARQRLVRAAAQVRLALLQHGAVLHPHADMPGVFVGVRVVRVDLVAHLAGERDAGAGRARAPR